MASELGQREAEGVGLLGLGVCRGLMEEFRLFRIVLGPAELVRVWGAVAPRKPKQKEMKGQKMRKLATVLPNHTAIFQKKVVS